jgi:hypothetical protein
MQTEKRKQGHDDHNQPDEINDRVHQNSPKSQILMRYSNQRSPFKIVPHFSTQFPQNKKPRAVAARGEILNPKLRRLRPSNLSLTLQLRP